MRIKKADNFFNDAEKDRISKAIEAVELSTSGEAAVMVVDESDSYGEALTLSAVFMSGLAALIVSVATHHVTIWSYLPMVLLGFFPARFLIVKFPRLKLPFIRGKRLTEAVRERAVRAFFEKELYRTRDATGILIFVSLLEHKVWILGDRGIDEKIPPGFWNNLAVELAAGIREGHPCETLCSTIARCGEELKKHFPRKPDDKNELTNELIFE